MSLLLGAGLLVSSAQAVRADNINTSGTDCQNFNAGQSGDIDYLSTAVRNLNAAPRPVICAMPRSPIVGNVAPSFFVDGSNSSNTTTTCTLTTYTFFGTVTNSVTFTEPVVPGPSVTWDHLVSLPLSSVGTFDYASVLCTLPGGAAGTIFGVTSVQ